MATPPQPTPEYAASDTRLRDKLKGFITLVDSKKEFDMVAVLDMYQQWYMVNNGVFVEEEDDSVALIEDFIKLCGKVESARASGKDAKADEFRNASIEIQRQIFNDVVSAVEFDEVGRMVVVKESQYNRVLDLVTFLTDMTEKIVEIGGNPKEFEGLTFLSGMRSMVYAECLVLATGATVSLDSVELDRVYDVDFLASKNGVVTAVSVGTIRGSVIPQVGFVCRTEQASDTNIPPEALDRLEIKSKVKIDAPSAKHNPQYYSNVRWGRVLGVPSQETVVEFRKVF
ncbi:TPA: hypothetical protein DIU27_02495 [Candidatus Collierbacteria bacterium]|uniref:Uncharacterized protein n=1 Tax=Candidatus Collierbacteria bacterium GW2011_GWB2_44_22 TaxID=1618387 RepID=A0A0G1KUB5_9BACT|nr:MAG: hypothetical protein UW31_C0008G0020 [Candidatus Collierbacteria bacterium GW2011_GWA2_44_13]KKT51000.1 MAG: hypothetical protein UW42_C0010G0014 [Candidatus Collierbacteria bacterium GW2011_GWB1_44_197]KKT51509.1 MAG: hypothetical protein UW44_C0011G0020 [Candidatus Collierbacteria bacterium GW2011_GWB2_44_22]KKT62246.1 MAG: hypothetical protein UW56_C0009G0020 [Candidatus Collierbacteria bacterium GW2011_GWD1_44_27]KKT66787.1 MAG: hypothetical protein UW58_C0003G0020 [Candidatus Colli